MTMGADPGRHRSTDWQSVYWVGNVHTCRTCDHWNAAFPKNPQLGLCSRLSVIEFLSSDPPAICLMVPGGDARLALPTRETIQNLRTVAEFGCVGWQERRPVGI